MCHLICDKGKKMSVAFQTVQESEKDIRLDRWFKRHYPGLPHTQLEKLLRKKNIRVDGGKAHSNLRLIPGNVIRIPPLEIKKVPHSDKKLSQSEINFMRNMVLYKDEEIIVLNKPAGLAVQGGSKTTKHIDGLLDALRFSYEERPRLVHRLDKETSGILIIARTAKSAENLSYLLKTKAIRKNYWALVEGLPSPKEGKIEAPLIQKKLSEHFEKRMVDNEGVFALSLYKVQDHLMNKVSWLQMSPLTGRTHQLRIHAADILKTPILGDRRYGAKGKIADSLPRKMFLHARAICIPRTDKKELIVEAPLPEHFKVAFQQFGFSEKNVKSSFLRSEND